MPFTFNQDCDEGPPTITLAPAGGCVGSTQTLRRYQSRRVYHVRRTPRPDVPAGCDHLENPNCAPPFTCPECNGGNVCKDSAGNDWPIRDCEVVLYTQSNEGERETRSGRIRNMYFADSISPIFTETNDDTEIDLSSVHRRRFLQRDNHWAEFIQNDSGFGGTFETHCGDFPGIRRLRHIIPLMRVADHLGKTIEIRWQGVMPYYALSTDEEGRPVSNVPVPYVLKFARRRTDGDVFPTGNLFEEETFALPFNENEPNGSCRRQVVDFTILIPVDGCDIIIDMYEASLYDDQPCNTFPCPVPPGAFEQQSVGSDLTMTHARFV